MSPTPGNMISFTGNQAAIKAVSNVLKDPRFATTIQGANLVVVIGRDYDQAKEGYEHLLNDLRDKLEQIKDEILGLMVKDSSGSSKTIEQFLADLRFRQTFPELSKYV